jgi:fructokinase
MPTASRCRKRSTAAGRGAEIVFGVILGTGVGGGIVIKQQVLTGANAIAGEWGHNPLPRAARLIRFAAAGLLLRPLGCVETYLSGPALAADHFQRTGETLSASRNRSARHSRRCGLRSDAATL